MTVVVDSGIWVSALHFGGAPQAALDAAFLEHNIAICQNIITEVREVLVRKFGWRDEEVMSVLNDYLLDAVRVEVTGIVSGICRDPKDDMVLECAVKARASLILSGDLDLLSLQNHDGISIMTVRQYLDR